ncbi:MAG: hypothetical protein ACRC2T_15025 [Thermoguttaceae bacterium]
MKNITFLFLIILTFSYAVGCSGQKRPSDMPPLVPCKITVMMDGSPVEGAALVLIPENAANTKWSAGGITNANGVLDVMTVGQYKGVVAGKYQVTVKKQQVDTPPSDIPYEQLRSWKPAPTVDFIDPKYGSISSTPINIDTDSLSGGKTTIEVTKPE